MCAAVIFRDRPPPLVAQIPSPPPLTCHLHIPFGWDVLEQLQHGKVAVCVLKDDREALRRE